MRRAAWCLLTLSLSGCAVTGGDASQARIRLVIPDNNIREEGIECAGARPFRQIRRGTEFRVEAEDGEVVADGELPAGRAENADPSIEWGVDRIPTVCVIDLELELPERAAYRLVLPDTLPLEFDASLLEREQPLQLVLSG